jgi:thiazole/oxazole-forming peptide maturase SagD family component
MDLRPDTHALRLVPLDFSLKDTQGLRDAACHLAGDWILAALERFERLFALVSPLAPGLAFVGAQASAYPFDLGTPLPIRFSAGGTGVSFEEALTSCLGEGLEFLSHVERDQDVTQSGTMEDVRGLLDPAVAAWLGDYQPDLLGRRSPRVDWLRATSADGSRTSLMPADLCLRRSERRRKLTLRGPLSTGCAVGRSRAEAALRAILEVVERDAVALWWHGGRRGRPVPPDGAIARDAAELLARLRAGQGGRIAWLLDITTDVGVPTFAALSVDGTGRRLACGFAARLAARDAARAAILEMAQVEVAYPLVALKLSEGGLAALDETDHRHLRRGELDAQRCPLLHPAGLPHEWSVDDSQITTGFEGLLQPLGDRGMEVWLTELTRTEHGIAAMRALVPKLQPFPSGYKSPRLLSVIANCGGNPQYGDVVDIL